MRRAWRKRNCYRPHYKHVKRNAASLRPFSTTAAFPHGRSDQFSSREKSARGHAKKVGCSSTLTRFSEQASGQKMRRLDKYRES